ncbi:hypothetical protein KRX54_01050 [Actinomycetaceae bacterium TAE3-ERU4]|nr:hypothetical protein [Actinomycetaceae bacterium TAE3-ERU4]
MIRTNNSRGIESKPVQDHRVPLTWNEITRDAAIIEYEADDIKNRAANTRKEATNQVLLNKAAEYDKLGKIKLLEKLADLGFSWRDIAKMLNVSVVSVRKWRRDQSIAPINRKRISLLLALCDYLKEEDMINEVASWFEIPIYSGVPITPIDLFAKRKENLLIELAKGKLESDRVLDNFDPSWRDKYRSDFEVFIASDGNLSIRLKETE